MRCPIHAYRGGAANDLVVEDEVLFLEDDKQDRGCLVAVVEDELQVATAVEPIRRGRSLKLRRGA